MQGYDVVTIDDEKVGTVVAKSGNLLIIEHGLLRKTKRALPTDFAHVDEAEKQVRITVAKEVLDDSPEVDGEPDERAVAEYYGLAPSEGPGTEGYGETVPGDPARSAEEQGHRAGIMSAPEERARIREGEAEPQRESPALLGERHADSESQKS